MSYYFCIVGTRDNPLYQAELASRAGSSGPASFFGSSSSSSSNNNLTGSGAAAGSQSGANSAAGGASGTGSTGLSRNASTSSTTGGVFGFGNALGSITSGFGGGAGRDGGGGAGTAQGGVGAPAGSGGDGKGLGFGRYNDKHVLQMIAHSALDVVEDKQFMSQAMYLKGVDRMNEWTTSALIAPGNLKFLILHEHKHDDGIRNFLYDVWEMVVKIMANPFHDLNDPITSPSFDAKVRSSARRHL